MATLLNYIDSASESMGEVDETFSIEVVTDVDSEIKDLKAQLRIMDAETNYSDEALSKYQEIRDTVKKLEAYKDNKYPAFDEIRKIINKLDDLNKPFLREVGSKFFSYKGTVSKGDKIRENEDMGGIYNTEVSGYLFRGVSLRDYNRIKELGYIDTDMRGVISKDEGINLASSAGTSFNYLPDNEEGVVMAIKVSDPNNLFQIGADDYVRASKPIPFTDVKMVTTPSIGMAFTAIKGGKTIPVQLKEVKHKEFGLTKSEVAEYKSTMMGLRVRSTSELSDKLKQGFLPEGYFNPNRISLNSTNIYNGEEITDILTNTELQEKIKAFIYKLGRLDNEVLNDVYTDENFLVIKDGTKNGIGKFNLENPYLIERAALEVLGGITSREEFEEVLFSDDSVNLLTTPYLESQGTKADLFTKFKAFKDIAEIQVIEGNLQPKTDSTREVLEQVLTEPKTTQLEENLKYLLDLEADVYASNPEAVSKLLKAVTKDMLNIGLDVTEFEKVKQGKTVEELKSFLDSVYSFLTTETDLAFDNLINTYNEFFKVSSEFKYRKLVISDRISKQNSFFLEDSTLDIKLFNDNGLIPIGENVYKRFKTGESLETSYENLYKSITTHGYNSILNEDAFKPSGFDSDGTLNLSKVTDPNNKDNIIRDIKAYIQAQTVDIFVGEENISQEVLEEYVLKFNYINRSNDLNKFTKIPSMETEYSNFKTPVSNEEYLKSDFIADFFRKSLKEKSLNSLEFTEFYSNFAITNAGIKLVNTDPISLMHIDKYIADNKDLVDYLKLHKSGIDLDTTIQEDPKQDDLFLRNYYINFPTALKAYRGDYSKLSNKTLIAENKSPFLRLGDGVYEMIYGIGSKGVYGKLSQVEGMFKQYRTTLRPPTLDIDISELSAIDVNIESELEVNNIYSEEEKNEINNQYDNC